MSTLDASDIETLREPWLDRQGAEQAIGLAEQERDSWQSGSPEYRAWEVQIEQLRHRKEAADARFREEAEGLTGKYAGDTSTNYSERGMVAIAEQALEAEGLDDSVRIRAYSMLDESRQRTLALAQVRDNIMVKAMAAGIAEAYRNAAEHETDNSRKQELLAEAESNERRSEAAERKLEDDIRNAEAAGFGSEDIEDAQRAGEAEGQRMARDYIAERGLDAEALESAREEDRRAREEDRRALDDRDRRARERRGIKASFDAEGLGDITLALATANLAGGEHVEAAILTQLTSPPETLTATQTSTITV